jgi:hypothetical protein
VLPDPIAAKICLAEDFYFLSRNELLGIKKISDLLEALGAAIRDSHGEMRQRGIVELCRQCDEKEGGSCCGSGLEAYYSETLLLINLLLGVDLPKERAEPTSCFFLSRHGCELLARHVICINYLCKKITDHFHPQELAPLREKEGIEVELLFRLNEEVKKYIHVLASNTRRNSFQLP